jgi:large subunit ribosomal protein L30
MPRTFVWHPSKGPKTVAPNNFKDGEMVKIKQVRSGIGHEARMRRTLLAMGLRNHQAVVERAMTPGLRGQIKQVRHLVEVTGTGSSAGGPAGEPKAKPASNQKAAKKATTPKASAKSEK